MTAYVLCSSMKWKVEKQILLCIPFPQMHNDRGRLCPSGQSWVLKDWLRMHLHQPCSNELAWEMRFSWGGANVCGIDLKVSKVCSFIVLLVLCFSNSWCRQKMSKFCWFTKCSMEPKSEQLNNPVLTEPSPQKDCTSTTSLLLTIWTF